MPDLKSSSRKHILHERKRFQAQSIGGCIRTQRLNETKVSSYIYILKRVTYLHPYHLKMMFVDFYRPPALVSVISPELPPASFVGATCCTLLQKPQRNIILPAVLLAHGSFLKGFQFRCYIYIYIYIYKYIAYIDIYIHV